MRQQLLPAIAFVVVTIHFAQFAFGSIANTGAITNPPNTTTGVYTGVLSVGDAGMGLLNVNSGGRFTSSSAITAGLLAGSVGSIDIADTGTFVSSAGLIVVANGSGRFILRDGARFNSSTIVNVTQDATSVGMGFTVNVAGRIKMAGGRLETTQALNTAINVSGLLEGFGALDAQGVTVGFAGRLEVHPGDRLEVTGLISNNGLVNLNGGELSVRGVLNNNNDIDARNGAILRVGATGLDNNSGDQLSITWGQVDVSDFGIWNANKLASSAASTVPEPIAVNWAPLIVALLLKIRVVRGRNT